MGWHSSKPQKKNPINLPEVIGGDELPTIQMSELSKNKIAELVGNTINLILAGIPKSRLAGRIMKETGLAYEDAELILDLCAQVIKNDMEFEIENEKGTIHGRLNYLYQKAMAEGDNRTALEVLKTTIKFRGLGEQNDGQNKVNLLFGLVDEIEEHASEIIDLEPEEEDDGE